MVKQLILSKVLVRVVLTLSLTNQKKCLRYQIQILNFILVTFVVFSIVLFLSNVFLLPLHSQSIFELSYSYQISTLPM